MKEPYISPEVEILCFAPVEAVAADDWSWNTWGLTRDSNGSGKLPGNASDEIVEGGVISPDVDGEG